MKVYIYIRIYIKVNYAINRIHEKAFKSHLSTQIKRTSLLIIYYELLFPLIHLYLVILLDFSVIFWFFFWALGLISFSAFSLCTLF